jgi:hypothetical protein
MSTNFYFNNFKQSGEQALVEDLIIESIRIYGVDTYYIPRTIISRDPILREQKIAEFNSSYSVELYIKDFMNFKGDGKFLSRYDLEIRDEITFTLARRVFTQDIGNKTNLDRPREGDLIWFPFNRKAFQISYVAQESIFYQFGALQVYDITCELFEYSNEKFNCGIEEIDNRYNVLSTNMQEFTLTDTEEDILADTDGVALVPTSYNIDNIDNNSQKEDFADVATDIVDFSEDNPFSENKFK